MALRIREDGRVLCAALHPPKPGDTYLHDGISYMLTVETKALVTDDHHMEHGEWWWNRNSDYSHQGRCTQISST